MKKLALLVLSVFPSALAQGSNIVAVNDYYDRTWNAIVSAITPQDTFSWISETSKLLVQAGVYDFIALVASFLFSIAIVGMVQNYLVTGSVALRHNLPRFVAAFGIFLLTVYPSSSTASPSPHHTVITFWPEAYNAVAHSSYVQAASVEFREAAGALVRLTLGYGSAALALGSLHETVSNTMSLDKTKKNPSARFNQLSYHFVNTDGFVENQLSFVYSLLGANVAMFLALSLVYSLATVLAGFTYVFAILLMPLAAALYMFRPTSAFLGRLTTAAISALLLVMLLPFLLSITLKASITRNQEITADQVAKLNAYGELAKKIQALQSDEIERALQECLNKGYRLTGAASTRPVQVTYSPGRGAPTYTVTGQYYALPATGWCDTTATPTSLTSAEIEKEISTKLLHGAVGLTHGDQGTDPILMALMNTLGAALSSFLAFFLFVGTINITSRIVGGVNIGGALENPLL